MMSTLKILLIGLTLISFVYAEELPSNMVFGTSRKYRLFQTKRKLLLPPRPESKAKFYLPKGSILLSPADSQNSNKNKQIIETVIGRLPRKDLKPVHDKFYAAEFHIPEQFCIIDLDKSRYLCQDNFPIEGQKPQEFDLKSVNLIIDDYSECDPAKTDITVHKDLKRLQRLEAGGPKHHSIYIYLEKQTKQVIQIHSSVSGWECH